MVKKNYAKDYVIDYRHTTYYKKSEKALRLSDFFGDTKTNSITRYRRRRISLGQMLSINSFINRKLTKALTNYRLRNTKTFTKVRRPVLRLGFFSGSTPMHLFFNNNRVFGNMKYSFIKKNLPIARAKKKVLKRIIISKKKLNKRFKYITKSLRIKQYKAPMRSVHKPVTLKVKNKAYAFTLKNSPLYISYRFRMEKSKFIPFKSTLKKLIFSFLKPNQIKRSLMLRRQKITYFRFFNRFNRKDMRNKFLLSNYSRVFTAHDQEFTDYSLSNFRSIRYRSYTKPFFSSITDNTFLQKFPNHENFKGEVHIPRVRFKPGYQRLWRQSRSTLAEALRIRYIYQQQFTKYINRFGRKLQSYHFSKDEYATSTIILYSRLVSDYNTLLLLNKNHCVSVNGYRHSNLDYLLFAGDTVQLLVSNWMYIYLKWILVWTSSRVKKFRKLVYRKSLAGSYRVMKTRKQKSNYTPLWIHYTKYDISDIKPFLETDFFTMSSTLIYDNFMFDFYTPSWFIEDRQTIYRLYNWKYIT